MDLTAMEIANASLLDEATAAAEAMACVNAQARAKATCSLLPMTCIHKPLKW